MRIFFNKEETKGVMIADTDDDYNVIFELYHRKMCYNTFELKTITPQHKDSEHIKPFLDKYGKDIKGALLFKDIRPRHKK